MYIRRDCEKYLDEWKNRTNRKPLIIRGARQVGKSWAVSEFGKERFRNIVTLNFEKEPRFKDIFERNDSVKRIVSEIEILKNVRIESGETLLFLDEIQECPAAITKLRYFYEELPALHVVAAGSLLEFVLEREAISFPVGRVEFLYLFPLTFAEYLNGAGEQKLLDYINGLTAAHNIPAALHEKARTILKDYLLVGGMPEAASVFLEGRRHKDCERIAESVLETYREDFKKYSPRVNTRNLEFMFAHVPEVVGQQVNLTNLGRGEVQFRELSRALDLLEKAMVVLRINRLKSVAFPLRPSLGKRPKLIFLDVGLVQYVNRVSGEIVQSHNYSSISRGGIAEQFVGQQLIPLVGSTRRPELFYWHRDEPTRGMAEIDFVFPHGPDLIPVEVKAGKGTTLASMHQFMSHHSPPIAARIYDGALMSEKISVELPQSGAKVKYALLSLPLYLVHRLPDLLGY